MINDHVISDEAFTHIQAELALNKHWLAYNTISYFLDKNDVELFHNKQDAIEHADNNFSDHDNFMVIQVNSISDVMREIPYGKQLDKLTSAPDTNGLYHKDGNGFTDALIDHIEQNQFIHSNKTKTIIMNENKVINENNFKYLDDQIFYKNFGRGHSEQLKEKMKEGQSEFMLTHLQDFGKDSTVATLHFKKSNETDMYFFNNYRLAMKPAGQEHYIQQSFYINNDPKKREQEDFTLKEGYNLLSGRAVNKNLVSKEGSAYNAWVQLDFKTTDKHGNYEEKKFHQNYGFNLEQSLAKHPIKELADPTERERLMDSLKRGNRQSVTFQHGGTDQKIFIEAAPQYKGLNFYDSSMKRLNIQTLYEGKSEGQTEKKQEGQSEKKGEGKSAAVKQEPGSGSDEEGAGRKSSQKSSKRKNQGQQIS